MGNHGISVPRAAPAHSPRYTHGGIVHFNSIGVYPQIRTGRILFSKPAERFVACASGNASRYPVGGDVVPKCGCEGDEERPEAEAAKGAALVYFGFVEEYAWVSG